MDSAILANMTLLAPWSYVDDVCRWAIVLIGVATALAVRRKLGMAAVPLAGLFVLLADSHLYWARFLIKCLLFETGYLENVAGTLAWYVGWQLIPVVFAAVMAAAFASEVRKRSLHRDASP
jgi:hypothetical protein